MIVRDLIDEEIELKRLTGLPRTQKPTFDWARSFEVDELPTTGDRFHVQSEKADHTGRFDATLVAATVGEALTDLLLSRKVQEDSIYSEPNRRLVARIARAVSEGLLARAAKSGEEGPVNISANDISALIERALIKFNEHDVAKSFAMRRHHDLVAEMRAEEEITEAARSNTSGPRTVRVIRRSGEVVAWNPAKIENAIRKAFLSLRLDSSPAATLATAITNRISESGQDFIHIEDVQDRVQEELMRAGQFKVAETFILYRAHRNDMRADQAATAETELSLTDAESGQQSLILIKKPDGSTFLWDGTDLRKRIEYASLGLDLNLTHDQIDAELRRSLFEEMTTADLQKTIILNAKSLIEQDADFAKFTARILLTYIYEEATEWDIATDGIEKLPAAHRAAFKANLNRGIEIGRISPRLRDFDLDKLAAALDPTADLDFDYLGIQTLYDRYLIIDKTSKTHRRIETPQLFWMRVSMGLFVGEKEKGENPEDRIIGLYNLYRSRRFCSSTPTLFNSGTKHSQLSSCYLYKIDDSIESIMIRGIAENAFLSKWAGGLGGSWTSVRGTGGFIHGTNGESQGVIPFLKLHNDQLVAVNQGGKRKGSGCAYLETWHNDIFDFFELRKNTGDDRRRTHDMNTANWIPDLFMKRMEAREDWTLFRSNEVSDLHDLYGKAFETRYELYEQDVRDGKIFGRVVPALDVWKAMLKMLFETGHPWITFKDPCNLRSPQDHVGVIHSSNLCTEITLNTSEEETAVCNLGSIVIDSHLDEDNNIDHEKLRDSIRTAVRALDNVIDINFYPTEAAKTANTRHRPIGLGVMGLQNALYAKGIAFSTEAALEFNDEMMEAITYYAYEASSDLAKEKGSYSSFEGSKWHRGLLPPDTVDLLEKERGQAIEVPRGGKLDWDALRNKIQKQGMRNSNVIAIAPTATISNIMGSTPCIEPTYKNLFVKSNLSGDFTVLNRYLVADLKKEGLWDKEMLDRIKYHDGELDEIEDIPAEIRERYKTAFGVEHQWIIDAAARRQKWIDQSQSVNLFLADPDMKTLSHMYRRAWRTGLKTTYYLRTMAASSIEKVTTGTKKDVRGIVGNTKREFTAAEQQACSLDAMARGEECEACQ